ncbi:helix-turn-helix domain-containing protein [Caballeronia sp. LZ008]|uniref:helix-turn-helix domain-containing protein n=1 Tax=unclassified Caballeronia TaxID=2646786 RepID=UPI002027F7E5|nr:MULTISPECIES: helix-turn-helix domain-containing protein [unclassified Caballeronia]MDR5794209.1 helix-turn-helix domain-containing protein [Caballeronia sp. LZ008]
MNERYLSLMTRAGDPQCSDGERALSTYKALRLLCDEIVEIRESPRNHLSSIQRAVIVVSEACAALGLHLFQHEPLLVLAMWAESKTKFSPFLRIDDVVDMVESLAERCAEQRDNRTERVIVTNPSAVAEYVTVEIPVARRDVALTRFADEAMYDLSDSPDPDEMRVIRRTRRRLVRKRQVLTVADLCRRAGISRTTLRRRVKHGTMFAIVIGRARYYPAFFARNDRLGTRLARVCGAMKPTDDAWGAYFELVYRFESLGSRTLLQVMRRAVGFRAAMRYARAFAGN